MPLTRTKQDLVRFLRHNYGDALGNVADSAIDRAIQNGLERLQDREWRYLHDSLHVVTKPPFRNLELVSLDSAGRVATLASDGTMDGDAQMVALSVAVNGFMQVNRDNESYRVIDVPDPTDVLLEREYLGDQSDLPQGVSIVFPLVDLPQQFWTHTHLWDTQDARMVDEVHSPVSWWSRAWLPTSGDALAYSVVADRRDPDRKQLLLPTIPESRRAFELMYIRRVGWYDGADPMTATWKPRATLGTDYVDWPDSMASVLESSIVAALYEETGDMQKAGMAQSRHIQAVERARAADRGSSRARTLSDGGARHMANHYQFRVPGVPL